MSVHQPSLASGPGLRPQVLTLVAEGGKLAGIARSKGSGQGIDTLGILGVLCCLQVLPLQNKIKMVTTAEETETTIHEMLGRSWHQPRIPGTSQQPGFLSL